MDTIFMTLPNMEAEELMFLQNITKDMPEDQKKQFVLIYQGKRRDPQMMLILTLLGFVGVAGVHRMMQGELGLGIIYLFTAGMCFIGTIVDIFNYKKLTNEYNQRMAGDCIQLMKLMH